MSLRTRHILFLVIAGCLLAIADVMPALANTPATNGILANIQGQYKTATQGWIPNLQTTAKHIFFGLAVVELVWSFAWWTLEKNGIDEFFIAFLRKVMGLSFFWAILLNAPTWIPQITATFIQIGSQSANVTALNPGDIFDLGIKLSSNMFASASVSISSLGSMVESSGMVIVTGIAALLIAISFSVAALSLLIALIESYMVISAGMVLLGFSGSRWTSSFAEKYLSANVSVGIKLMVTYLIVGAGQSITTQWTTTLNGTSSIPFQDVVGFLGASLIYAGLVWMIPSMASGLLSGNVNMTLGGVGAASAMMAGGAAGVAAGGAALAGGAASGVGGAIKAGQAAMAGGALRGGGTKGFAAALGSGIKSSIGGIGQSMGQKFSASYDRSPGGRLASTINNQSAALREQQAAGGPPPAPAAASSQPPSGSDSSPPPPPAGGDAAGGSGGGADSSASGAAPASPSGYQGAGNSSSRSSGDQTVPPPQAGGAGVAQSGGEGATAAPTPQPQPGAGPSSTGTAAAPAPAQVPPAAGTTSSAGGAAPSPAAPATPVSGSPISAAAKASRAVQQAMRLPNDGGSAGSVSIPLKHHE